MDPVNKKKLTTGILKKSIDLLTPIANDVNGLNSPAQYDCMTDIARAMTMIVNDKDGAIPEEYFITAYNRISNWAIKYHPDNI